MKKLALLAAVVAFSMAAFAEPTAADHKWLEAVQKMVSVGQTRVSTPSQDRVTLLKEWASAQGYSIGIAKTDSGFRVELTKQMAKN